MKKSLAIMLALIMLLCMIPTVALAKDGNDGGIYGSNYNHIDVKVDGKYTVKVDGVDYTIDGTLQADSIKVKIGTKDYIFKNVKTNEEAGRYEYEISVRDLSYSDIAWVAGTYKMTNVYVTARMLFKTETMPDALKSILLTTVVDNTTYYYADITDMQYNGVQECTKGNGLRSEGNKGTPTGLDLYITAEGAGVYITKGKLAIEKKIVDEAGTAVTGDNTTFTFTVTANDTGNAYNETVTVKGGETVTLTDLPAGSYTVTETQQTGYAIRSIDGETTTNYSKDYVIVAKEDTDIPVATFTNTKLTEQSSVNIKKTASGLPEGAVYPTPTISIYAADNEGKKSGDAIWSGTLTANGDTLYLTPLFENGTYVVEETYAEVDGYDCATTLSVTKNGADVQNSGMTFTVSEKAKTYSLTVNNQYSTKEVEPTGSLTINKKVEGLEKNELPAKFTFEIKKGETTREVTVKMNDDGTGYEAAKVENLPVGEYTVVEKDGDVDGYKLTATSDHVDGTVEVTKEGTATITFTNKYEEMPPETGALTVKKTVSGGGADYNKAFTFTVKLEGNGDTPNNEITYGDVTFTNGVATFTLKHNQEKTITEIPEGMTYTVTENNDGYTVTKSGDTGTIEAGKTAIAAFNNYKAGTHYHPDPTPVPPIIVNPPKTGDMTIWQSILNFFGIR